MTSTTPIPIQKKLGNIKFADIALLFFNMENTIRGFFFLKIGQVDF